MQSTTTSRLTVLPLVREPRSRLWVRDGDMTGESDRTVIEEIEDYAPVSSREIVLDIGANIGAYSCLVARDALKVYAVEPDPESFCVLSHNALESYNLQPIQAAVSASWAYEIFLNRGDWPSRFSTVTDIDRPTRVAVPNVHIQELLDQTLPTVIKVDIEGGEFELFPSLLWYAHKLKILSIEIHRRDEAKKAAALAFIGRLADLGFNLGVKVGQGSAECNWLVNAVRKESAF